MITIPIQVSGDIWNNRDTAKQLLDQTQPGQSIMLDLCSEGPSLKKLGVTDLISNYDLDVWVTRWSNGIESVPYKRNYCNSHSHFFPMSWHYWVDEIENTSPTDSRFGLFQGRGCPSRNRILYDTFHKWPGKFLVSKMSSLHGDNWGMKLSPHASHCENVNDWFDDAEQAVAWLGTAPVCSIDNHVIQDQYRVPEISSGDMARSLFQYYPMFNIELVCETYTLGDTFFPTEKTIRPIVGNKPFIVYGPVNYLNNLKKDNFQTFSDLWDESYDQLEGVARWSAISKLIDTLANLPDAQWQEIINQAANITRHNRSIVRKKIRDFKGV
jgi:hypothetical protein